MGPGACFKAYDLNLGQDVWLRLQKLVKKFPPFLLLPTWKPELKLSGLKKSQRILDLMIISAKLTMKFHKFGHGNLELLEHYFPL